jgi:hypothetical protein
MGQARARDTSHLNDGAAGLAIEIGSGLDRMTLSDLVACEWHRSGRQRQHTARTAAPAQELLERSKFQATNTKIICVCMCKA